jgi:hypothetical protein
MLRHEQFGSSGWQFDASLVELLGCDIGRDQGRGHSIGANGGNKGGAGGGGYSQWFGAKVDEKFSTPCLAMRQAGQGGMGTGGWVNRERMREIDAETPYRRLRPHGRFHFFIRVVWQSHPSEVAPVVAWRAETTGAVVCACSLA